MNFTEILKREVVPALGCTEPIAIALAAATASKYAEGNLKKLELYASKNIIKNAMGVGIPKTDLIGIDLAMALGYLAGDSEKELEVLSTINDKDVENAQNLIKDGKIKVDLSDTSQKLYIEIIANTDKDKVKVIIQKMHNNITLIEKNGEIILSKEAEKEDGSTLEEDMNINSIIDYIMSVDKEEIKFMSEGPELNMKIAEDGFKNHYGLELGRTIKDNVKKGYLSDDIMNEAIAVTVAATDARMAGSSLPVMSTSGSGNQGIIATLPIYSIGLRLKLDEERINRALALSHLIAYYIKKYLGRLSALCGCGVAAGIGSSCGITYLLGGGKQEIIYAIKNMVGDVSGIVCDGAKTGCSLKASSCTYAAIRSALMAVDGKCISSKDGIISDDVEDTIKNLSLLASEGMANADETILKIMLNK